MADQPAQQPLAQQWIDCEMMGDGSRRWLWRVINEGALWAAGVRDYYSQAHYEAALSYAHLMASLTVAEQESAPSAADATVVDLDSLTEAPEVHGESSTHDVDPW